MLSRREIAEFRREGYLRVPRLFSREEIDPLRREIEGLVDSAARRLFDERRIPHLRREDGFETRLTRLMADSPDLTGEYLRSIEGRAGGGHAGRAMFNVITNPALLDLIESLVGPEIVGSSVYRIRPKAPGLERGVVPWHQDSGYFAAHCDSSLIVTVWIPLVDATPENGCLRVLPRAHRSGVYAHHTGGPGGYLIIEERDLPAHSREAVDVPVPLGGALLMTNLTPHCSTPNRTSVIRWAVDLRYQSLAVPTNASQSPDEFNPAAPAVEMACYPPEADFIVRSRSRPESVHTYGQFAYRRAAYEAAAGLPYPRREWAPREA